MLQDWREVGPHYKIKRHSAGKHKNKVKRLKVRVVVQGQHMSKEKGDFKDAFSPVPHLSGVRCCMSVATGMKWKAVGVDLTQVHYVLLFPCMFITVGPMTKL